MLGRLAVWGKALTSDGRTPSFKSLRRRFTAIPSYKISVAYYITALPVAWNDRACTFTSLQA